LELYEKASGQKLNRDKTFIFFSKNTKKEVREHILSLAKVNSTQRYENYLGLPALVGRSKIRTFTGIKGKIWNRINGWKEKNVTGEKGNFSEGGYRGYSYLHYECIPITQILVLIQ
jgi:hypothetical protein